MAINRQEAASWRRTLLEGLGLWKRADEAACESITDRKQFGIRLSLEPKSLNATGPIVIGHINPTLMTVIRQQKAYIRATSRYICKDRANAPQNSIIFSMRYNTASLIYA